MIISDSNRYFKEKIDAPETIVSWLRRCDHPARICEGVVAGMSECNVSHAEVVVLTKDTERVAELMSAVKNSVYQKEKDNSVLRKGISRNLEAYPSTPRRLAIRRVTIAS